MAIPATRKQLIKSFWRHWAIYCASDSNRNTSHLLLLFYAAECGLKSILLEKIKRNSTESFSNHAELSVISSGKYGHDINRMLDFLKLSKFYIPNVNFENTSIPVFDLHTVWRYGIEIPKNIEYEVESKLKRICDWIKEVL